MLDTVRNLRKKTLQILGKPDMNSESIEPKQASKLNIDPNPNLLTVSHSRDEP